MWGEKDYFMILEGELRYLDVDLYYNSWTSTSINSCTVFRKAVTLYTLYAGVLPIASLLNSGLVLMIDDVWCMMYDVWCMMWCWCSFNTFFMNRIIIMKGRGVLKRMTY
jgi:hypothetical protein